MPGPGGIVPGMPGTPIGRGIPGCVPIGTPPIGRGGIPCGGMPGWPIGICIGRGGMPGWVPIGTPIGRGGMPG